MTNRRDFLTRMGLASMALAAAPLVSTRSYFFAPNDGWSTGTRITTADLRRAVATLDRNNMSSSTYWMIVNNQGDKRIEMMIQQMARQNARTIDKIVIDALR